MEEEASAIQPAFRAGMDGCNEQWLAAVQCRLGERIGMALLQAGRPVAVAVAAAAKGVGKKAGAASRLLGTYHCIPAAAVAVVMSAGILRRDVEKRSMILGAGTAYVQPWW